MALEPRNLSGPPGVFSWLAPKAPAICGKATLAMEVSSTSMKVARVTVSAINQGLCLGCHPSTEVWCPRLETGFGCGCSVAVTNVNPGEAEFVFLDCTKVHCGGIQSAEELCIGQKRRTSEVKVAAEKLAG